MALIIVAIPFQISYCYSMSGECKSPFADFLAMTVSQCAAANPSVDVIATAGAGTGKTRLLAARYLWTAAQENSDIHRIAAMTFSEKAAAEMWKRICQNAFYFFRISHDVKWFELYRNLQNASISTIHSFCLRLLMMFPMRAQLDPYLDVEPGEIAADQLVDDFLFDFARKGKDETESLLRLMRRYRRRHLRNILCELFHWRQMATDSVKTCARIDTGELAGEYCAQMAQRWNDFRDAVERNSYKIIPKTTGGTASAKKWKWIIDNVPNRVEPPDTEFLAKLKANLSRLKLNAIDPELDELRELFRAFPCGIEELRPLADDVISFAKLYVDFERYLWFGWDKYRTVDFSELLLRADELMNVLSDAEKSKVFPLHILMDEFQDTSPVQWRLAEKMNAFAKTMLFVGDEKQSIYRFRGADVEIVRRGEKLITQRAGKSIQLSDNFRTAPRLLKLMNDIFRRIFPIYSDVPFEARFQELECKREKSFDMDGSLCIVQPEDGAVSHETACRLISSALDGKFPWGDGDAAIPDDFMVLARSRKTVFQVLKELRRKGIPAIPLSESGFYNAPEIAAIINLLKFLADNRCNGALYALLHSPAFGIGDDEISKEIAPETGKTLWEKLQNRIGHEPENSKLSAAFRAIDELNRAVETMSPEKIIDKFLDMENILAMLAGEFSRVALPNIGKLLAHIRMLVCQSHVSIDEVVRTLCAERSDNHSGYAIPLETKDVVRVSTIHSAKGLEAKTVIIIDPGKRLGGNNRHFYIEPDLPGGFIPSQPKKSSQTIIHKLASDLSSKKDEAEYLRRFYVAMTRAKDNIIVIGSKGRSGFAANIVNSIGGKYDKKIELPEPIPPGFFSIRPSQIESPPGHYIRGETTAQIDLSQKTVQPAGNVVLSAHKISRYIACPRMFHIDYRGIQNENTEYVDDESGKSSHAIAFGNAVHNLLSHAPFESVEQAIGLAQIISPERRLVEVVSHFLECGIYKRILRDGVMNELPLWLRFGDITISGIADAVTLNPPAVWDYKTGNSTPLKSALYHAQVNVYRLAIAKWKSINPEDIYAAVVWANTDGINVENVPWDAKIADKILQLSERIHLTDNDSFPPEPCKNICETCKKCDEKSIRYIFHRNK